MDPLAIVKIAVGLGVVAIGVYRIRHPRAMVRHLEETEANLRRYDEWRGGRDRDLDAPGPTGADIMKERMRRLVLLWGVVIAAGAVLVLVGLIRA